jgi:hypothetical protein
MKNILIAVASLALLLPVLSRGQDKSADSNSVRLTIVVTGGDDKQPVENASVYVKFVEERKVKKDKKIEMNVKTNQSGVCHVPEIPRGKFLVQVIAPGWKTFGEYYQGDQPEQTINIALVRPPKWY